MHDFRMWLRLIEEKEELVAQPFQHIDPITRKPTTSFKIFKNGQQISMVQGRFAQTPEQAITHYLNREQWQLDQPQQPKIERQKPKRIREPRPDVRVWIVTPKIRQEIQDGENAPDEWLYHVTSWPRARQIIRQGLRLERSPMFANYEYNTRGRIFLTERDGVMFWTERVEHALEHNFDRPPHVAVLRVKKSDVMDELHPDEIGTRDARAQAYYITANFA